MKRNLIKRYALFLLIIGGFLFYNPCWAQTKWTSPSYGYSLEIPEGFYHYRKVGANVDFKVVNGLTNIVIVVRSLPEEARYVSMDDIIGDIDSYITEYETGYAEFVDGLHVTNYGKTKIDGVDALWIDKETFDSFQKTYSLKNGVNIYAITLTCNKSEKVYWAPYWYRFKNSIKFKY